MVDPNLAAILALIGVIAQAIIGAVVVIMLRNNGVKQDATHELVDGKMSELLATTLAKGVMAGQAAEPGTLTSTVIDTANGNH